MYTHTDTDFPGSSVGKESACNAETSIQSLGEEDSLEKGMAPHSTIFACKIPWTEEPGGLQSIWLQRVRQDLATEHASRNK